MKNFKSICESIFLVALLALTPACGGSYHGTKSVSTPQSPPVVPLPPSSGGGSSGGSSGGNTSTGTAPLYAFDVHGMGYNAETVEVAVRNILKVRFTPGIQDTPSPGTGFFAQYSKLGVFFQVENTNTPTSFLNNGYSASPQSYTIDFSTAFTKTCSASDTTCRQTVQVKVQQPNYDHYCLVYGTYCPGNHVSDVHPWHGIVEIQTDDTQSL